MQVKEIYNWLDAYAPFAGQERWDNSGLLVGSMEQEVHGVLLTLDISLDAVEEAARKHCDLLLAHHPVIFDPLRQLTPPPSCVRVGTAWYGGDLFSYPVGQSIRGRKQHPAGVASSGTGTGGIRADAGGGLWDGSEQPPLLGCCTAGGRTEAVPGLHGGAVCCRKQAHPPDRVCMRFRRFHAGGGNRSRL